MTVRHMKKTMMTDAGPAGLPVLAGKGYYPFAGGRFTTTNTDTFAVSVEGVRPGDLAFASVEVLGTGSRSILTARCTRNTVTIIASGACSTNHVIIWMVFKPRNPASATRLKF